MPIPVPLGGACGRVANPAVMFSGNNPLWKPSEWQKLRYPYSQENFALLKITYGQTGDSSMTPAGTYPGTGAFRSGVLMADGRVFCVPYNSTTARIYDPATNTLSTPGGTYPGSGAFTGGCLLPDGRVFIMPCDLATPPRIYDPTRDALFVSGIQFSIAFRGCVLLLDGRIIGTPLGRDSTLIYDPKTDSVIAPNIAFPTNNTYTGCALLPDGRVFFMPNNAPTIARIYDPKSDAGSDSSVTFPTGTNLFRGCVLMADGRVFCVPAQSTTARIYDPATDTLSTPGGTYPGTTNAFEAGKLLPDGRVFIAERSSTTSRIYDPQTDTVTTTVTIGAGANHTIGCVLLMDGRIFMVPYNATTARIYGTKMAMPPSRCLNSSFVNIY